MTTEKSTVDRRRVLQSLGSLAIVGAVAGCSTDGGGDGGGDGGDGGSDGGDGGSDGGSDGGDGGSVPSEVEDYVSDSSNYEGVSDMTGQSEVTVEVGCQANGGGYGFCPPAIRVDSGTQVTWEWTGDGGSHDVTDEDGAFQSELVGDEGHTFSHTFDSSGNTLYFCTPHKAMGMKAAVIVE